MRQDEASEIVRRARDETGCADYLDKVVGQGKCGINATLLYGFSLAV